MDTAQKKAFKNRIDRLTKEKAKLAEKVSIIKKEKQRVEKSLRDDQRLLSEIPCPVALLQGNQLLFANEMAWELLGYTKEELWTLDPLDLVHPKSSEYVQNFLKKVRSSKPLPPRAEIYLQKKNGEPLFCDIQWKKIRHQDRTAFLLSVSDLSERKDREKRLQTALNPRSCRILPCQNRIPAPPFIWGAYLTNKTNGPFQGHQIENYCFC